MLAQNFQQLMDMVPEPKDEIKKSNVPLEKLYFTSDKLLIKADEFQKNHDFERSFLNRMKFIKYVFLNNFFGEFIYFPGTS